LLCGNFGEIVEKFVVNELMSGCILDGGGGGLGQNGLCGHRTQIIVLKTQKKLTLTYY